ncbi:MAG: hypothetical protein RBU21_02000 [FCB group bacterium]|jgi:hypothetical protein|nr:hypothetical protein [FCB group bacterium]
MHSDILFETNRFNLSEVKDHFINPCCFGEDLAAWLRGALAQKGITASEPGQEDWGWCLGLTHEGASYIIGVGGNSSESASDPNHGEWRIILGKHRSLWDKLTGKNRQTADDPVSVVILEILRSQPDFQNVHCE